MERVSPDPRPFCEQLLSEGVVVMEKGVRVPLPSKFYERFLLDDNAMWGFSTAGVFRGKGVHCIESSGTGIICAFQLDQDGASEITRYYPPLVTEMLEHRKRIHQRRDDSWAREDAHRGFVGAIRKTVDNVATRIRTGRTITIDQGGNVIKINGLASRYAYPFSD